MLKDFEIFFDDLTPDAQARMCKLFRTSPDQENWTGCGAQSIAETAREVEPIERKMQITYQLTVSMEEEVSPRDIMNSLHVVHFEVDGEEGTKIVDKELIEFSDDWE